jgi:hypothetical protein
MLLLESDWTEVTIGRMASLWIVPAFDVFGNCSSRLGPRSPAPFRLEFNLERREEALGNGIVPAVTLSAHAWCDSQMPEPIAILWTGVLTASIAMHDQSIVGTIAQRHFQGLERQLCISGIVHRPADHASGEAIDNHRQIDPALRSRNLRDIGNPHAIRLSDVKPALENIRRCRQDTGRGTHSPRSTALLASNATSTHQPGDPLAGGPHAQGLEFNVNARPAVTTSTRRVSASNQLKQRDIAFASVTDRAAPPSIISRLRHVETLAQRSNAVLISLRVNEAKSHRWSFAKKALAFFNISLASRSSAFSRRRRSSSICSLVRLP